MEPYWPSVESVLLVLQQSKSDDAMVDSVACQQRKVVSARGGGEP